ncbi:sugar transferase [Aliivibrio salmonicida]|jgi:lipopolysaccharide/colanic/teichoic acid biosynthesis glycosyltransferase|uniref:Sugar transferase n=1 Tax=Aliivibrio salmonicida (strain LFI1238) TaxID=316275 RepID=B6EQS1_ALISL|nr:sugar transferase [Aliivibrio salmonicida]AZL86465.1 sugar transferase [Aliivibrio salmonicida]CAQ81049.1 sugar transferase [Aliivibrio salmonicida LFI1238]
MINSYYTINQPTIKAKRAFDVCLSLIGLLITLPLFPLIAIAIKVNSKGPVFYRQLRVGKAMPEQIYVFEMIKFRSMVEDAEVSTGATLAVKGDTRVTLVGRFLRKTRLDELPQFFNVLNGDMSLVGPRPERPTFYNKLEHEIPYFSERTYGVLPGITGLAQVNQGYDTSIEDVRSKVGFDHSYALSLRSISSWIKSDSYILLMTIKVMLFARGQ